MDLVGSAVRYHVIDIKLSCSRAYGGSVYLRYMLQSLPGASAARARRAEVVTAADS
jgi:hypothetical protein